MAITNRGLATLKPGIWLTEKGNRNEGSLRAKGGPNGARLYYRYRDSSDKYDDLPIGTFDESGKRGLTLAQAREQVRALQGRYLTETRDLRTAIEADEQEALRKRKADLLAAEVSLSQAKATLGALLGAYVQQMKRDKKSSAKDVEKALIRNVQVAWPALWCTPASEIGLDDLVAIVAKLANAGKLREAAKLRAYLMAAYSAGMRAKQDVRGLHALRELNITANPARDLMSVDGANKTRERALSLAELRGYWKRISDMHNADGALLRFHLLSGGQRIEQLVRVTLSDIDNDSNAICLFDPKGRRSEARPHLVPLVPEATQAMNAMGPRTGPYLWTISAGNDITTYSIAEKRLRKVVEEMVKHNELEKGPFTFGALRRTVETRLAAAGVPKQIRGQLQSHGLSGIQDRHYDRHEYLPEKRAALETLNRLLTGKTATVTSIRRKLKAT